MEKKILYTASSYYHLRNFHRPYLRAFHERGWKVDIACGGAEMEIPEADRIFPLPFEKSMLSPRNLKATAELRKLVKRKGYDIVSTHTSLAAFFTRLAMMGLKDRPLVVSTAHGYLFDAQTKAKKRLVLLGAEKLTAGVTDLLMTMNAWDTALARRQKLGRAVREIPGIGVNFARFDAPADVGRAALRQSLGLTDGQFLMIYAAEFSVRKNQKFLIHALTKLPKNVVLLLPGNGVLQSECEALAQTLGVSGRVIFPGQLSDMPAWYRAADAAVSASRSEGLPFNIMESMYCSLPVIATDVKGNSDLIESGKNGLLYPYDDEDAYIDCVTRLLSAHGLAEALGACARESVLPYALDRVLPQVMALYESFYAENTKERKTT